MYRKIKLYLKLDRAFSEKSDIVFKGLKESERFANTILLVARLYGIKLNVDVTIVYFRCTVGKNKTVNSRALLAQHH